MIYEFIENERIVEVDTTKMVAYFHAQDYESPMTGTYEFEDWFGSKYQAILPFRSQQRATLQKLTWTTVAEIENKAVIEK